MKVNIAQTPKKIKFSELTIGDVFIVADRTSVFGHDYFMKTPDATVGKSRLKANSILLKLGAHSFVDEDTIVTPLNAELKVYE